MRSSLSVIMGIVAFIFLSASFTISEFAFTLGQVEPVLPSTPYNYQVDELPEYLLFPFTDEEDLPNFNYITDEGATLGRVLFYDELLSAGENLSCATCHSQEKSFADKAAFSMGVTSPTARNSMPLNDLLWSQNAGFFWDMSQSNLEEVIALPLSNPNENGILDTEGLITKMEATNYYPELFEKAYGNSAISMEKIQNAIAQFISSMTTFNSKFDRVMRGEDDFTQEEYYGRAIFSDKCASCHKELEYQIPNIAFTLEDDPFRFNNGLSMTEDLGAGNWNEDFNKLFKVPTLRNIEKTGPYMHDGRMETLEDVLDHYTSDLSDELIPGTWSSGFIPLKGFFFMDSHKRQLITFLKTLTDDTFLTDPKFSDPFSTVTTTKGDINKAELSLHVFPNPSTGQINIEYDNIGQRNVEVYIMSIDGKVVQKMSSHKASISADLSHLTKGTYLVRIMNSEAEWVDKKLILQ